jgi:hypothetical protein
MVRSVARTMPPFWTLRDFELREILELERATRWLAERLRTAPAGDRHPELADVLAGSLDEYTTELERRRGVARRLLR